jgi:hypothetical protein
MLSTSCAGVVTAGSYATVAAPVIRLTLADDTPPVCSSVRCTRPLQAAHVMPVTGMVQDSEDGDRVSGIPQIPGSATMVPRTMLMPQVNS